MLNSVLSTYFMLVLNTSFALAQLRYLEGLNACLCCCDLLHVRTKQRINGKGCMHGMDDIVYFALVCPHACSEDKGW